MIGRWIGRVLSAAIFVVVSGLLLAYLALRASLPELDGELVVKGIDGRVLIERDAAGIPTITAASRADIAFATGYAHGQDRFFQMDLIRRRAAGELAALFGTVAVDTDRRYRFHRFRARARQGLESLRADERELLVRYAAGVNAGLASLAAKPFEYLLLRSEPKPWRPEDSILVVYTMFALLNDSTAIRDVRRGLANRVLPAEVYAWLYPQGTGWDAPLMGAPRQPMAWPAEEVYSVRGFAGAAPAANEVGKPQLNGSNNWAVSGSLSKTGKAIVANDMHLGLSAPNIYYQARLVHEGDSYRAVTGVTLPGAPFVIAGSNSRVAWGYTNSYGDWTDAVVLKPGEEADTYRTPAGDRRFVEHAETILVKNAAPVDMVVRETIWGPVNQNVDYPEGEIAVSWIAHKAAAVNLRIIDLERADTVEDALAIANTMGLPPQNFVTGDADGNIAWTIAGKIPLRGGFDPMLPADWSESPGWVGWLDSDAYPRIVNPPSGRLWTANARVADGQALQIIGDGGYDLGARARQIRDGLFAKDRFEPADMLHIQYDDRALFLAPWRDLLLDILDDATVGDDPQLVEYRRLVRDWIPRAAQQSVGYRLVRAFRLEVQARVFHGLTAPVRQAYGQEDVKLRLSNQFEGPLWNLLADQPLHLLPGGYDSWQGLMLSAIRQNLQYFTDRYGGALGERTWGERNTARIRHPLSAALPMLAGFLDMPSVPLNGDVDLPKAQGPTFGASERFSVSPGDEANGLMHMPTGQSGHPLSDYYRRGHDDWVHGKPSPFLPGETRHTLTLTPAR